MSASELPNPDPTPVALMGAASDSYARHLTAALHSVASRVDPRREVFVFVVDGGMKPANLARACARIAAAHPHAQVVPVAPSAERLAGLPVSGRYPAAMYMPLLALDMLPARIGPVLCLDCDVIATEDVSPLFDMPLDGRPLWAVRDGPEDEHGARLRADFPEVRGVGTMTYVNTGVMLIDAPAWRSEGLGARVLGVLRRQGVRCVWTSQDAINVALAGRIGLLPDRWNNRLRGSSHIFPALAQTRPRGILHYCGGRKPWRGWCLHDHAYHAALLASGWHDAPGRLAYRLAGAARFGRSLYFRARYGDGSGAGLGARIRAFGRDRASGAAPDRDASAPPGHSTLMW